MTDKPISLSLPLTSSPIIFQLRKIHVHLQPNIIHDKNKFPTKAFWETRNKSERFEKKNILYLINTVMAEFKYLHNSSYLGLVYTWN